MAAMLYKIERGGKGVKLSCTNVAKVLISSLRCNVIVMYHTSNQIKSDNAFPWVSAHISGFNIVAPIEHAYSILHVSDLCNNLIEEINAL